MSTPYFTSSTVSLTSTEVDVVSTVYQGSSEAVKYLQKYVREDEDAFAYRQLTMTLLNVLRETVTASTATIFRKPLEFSGSIDDQEGREITNDAKDILTYLVRDGLAFGLVDLPAFDRDLIKSRADEIDAGIEPYIVPIERSRVKNFTKNDNGSYKTITVSFDYDHDIDEYKQEVKQELRVFKDDGVVEIWRENSLYDTITTGINYVPIVQFGEFIVPPLFDLAKTNISYMNRRSEKDRYLRIASAPIPVIWGKQGDEGITVGVDQALSFSRKEEGDFQWKELQGSSITLLQEDLDKLFESMVEFAVGINRNNTDQVKTATQVSKESISSESKLVDYAFELERGMNELLAMMSTRGGPSVQVVVNKDFDSSVLTPEQVQMYMNMFNNGAISLTMLWEILIEGEILPDDFDKEEAKDSLVLNGEGGISTDPEAADK